MGNRRFAQAPASDDDDATLPPRRKSTPAENLNRRKRKVVHFPDDDEDEKETEQPRANDRRQKKKKKKRKKKMKKKKTEEPEPEAASENEEQGDLDAQPIGPVSRVTGKGRGRRNHYDSFEYNGIQYSLEDPALFHPEEKNQKPYVAIIKDISQTWHGELMVTGQWFYRPEEAEKKNGGNWPLVDTRELFYSFHRDEVPAESVFHKCVVHFIPLNKQIPARQQHPGFIVQKVYDTEQKRLFKLTDKDYEENKQHEIDLLVQKTLARLGDLPDLVVHEDNDMDHEDQLKNKRLLRKRNISHLDVSRDDDGLGRSQSFKSETPTSNTGGSSEYHAVLSKFKVLTEETQRDRWLEKLLQCTQYICTPASTKLTQGGEKVGSDVKSPDNKNGVSNHESHNQDDTSFEWPDTAVPAIVALEKAAHTALSADFHKYNQKMRQLAFNLKSNATLARRLLKRELEPSQILNMSPNELKEGLTAEEIASREPEKSGRLQMTDARCKRCNEKEVGLIDIIQTGLGDRYQLECVACGNTWYASRDDAAALTIEGPNSANTVGTAPLATAKFEDVEKSLASPGRAEKGASTPSDALKKITEANIPLLDSQKSFNETSQTEAEIEEKEKHVDVNNAT